MDVYWFSEMPYAEFDESEADNYPSMRLTFPNTYFDAPTAQGLFQRYLDEYQYAAEVGFDGLMINEHHNSCSCMNVGVNVIAGILARMTTRAKILILGNLISTTDNPVRLAEEIAMVDLISGGRLISGIVRGLGVESWATNTNPVHNRERFEEAHDLMVKTWTTPGPFRWEGDHFDFRVVNPWVLPLQKPHPPIWTPGTGSPETVEWSARRGYTYAAFLTSLETAQGLFDLYRNYAAEEGIEAGPEKFAFMVCCHVNDTEEKAQEEGRHIMWRMRGPLLGPREYFAPPGYLSRAGRKSAVINSAKSTGGKTVPLQKMSYQELQDDYRIIVGTPDTVTEKLLHIKRQLGIGSLMLEAQCGAMSHRATMRSIELLGSEVIPALKED